jgi:branched-chain amino acid transport system ATP-binding protein
LQATGIRTSYGGVVAVEDVSLEVCAGDVVGIIGPNGAGKTTLFDVLSGFQPAENGSVLLFGADVTGMSASARGALGLQRSFQSVRLFPSLTVRDNIAVALETHLNTRSAALSALWLPNARRAEAKAQQRVDQLIELMELDEHQDKVMSEMSTGMRRIVDIACQLAARPKVLLLDEPSSGLAQTETEALGPIISRISKDLDCAVLVIEHDIPLVTAVSSTLVAMDLGRVIATGTPDEVVSDPVVRNAYFGGASDRVVQRSGQRRKAPAWEVVNV